jgi:hypothetical protein
VVAAEPLLVGFGLLPQAASPRLRAPSTVTPAMILRDIESTPM